MTVTKKSIADRSPATKTTKTKSEKNGATAAATPQKMKTTMLRNRW